MPKRASQMAVLPRAADTGLVLVGLRGNGFEEHQSAEQEQKPPFFPHFEELPDEARAAVVASLSEKDAVSAALACKSLHFIAAPFTQRVYSCAACHSNLFHPREIEPHFNRLVKLEDGPAYSLQGLPRGAISTPSTQMKAIFDGEPDEESDEEHGVRHLLSSLKVFSFEASMVLCGSCRVFLGIRVTSMAAMKESVPRGLLESLPREGWAYILKPYTRLLKMDGSMAHPACARPIMCSGRRAPGCPPDKPCGNILAYRDQILSRKHCWDAGSGIEQAFYLNAMRAGSFRLANHRAQHLAQGRMLVADTFCSRCQAQIGWKFCDNAPSREPDFCNQNQKGRFGLVVSSMTPSATATAREQPQELSALLFWAHLLGGDDDDDNSESDSEPSPGGWLVHSLAA